MKCYLKLNQNGSHKFFLGHLWTLLFFSPFYIHPIYKTTLFHSDSSFSVGDIVPMHRKREDESTAILTLATLNSMVTI